MSRTEGGLGGGSSRIDGGDTESTKSTTANAEGSDAQGTRSLMREVLEARHEEGGKERTRDYHRMGHLITNAMYLNPARMKELICLRFGTDNRSELKKFWLRLHPDKTSTRCENRDKWIAALGSALKLLDLCEQYSDFERLNVYKDYLEERMLFDTAVGRLRNACVPDDPRKIRVSPAGHHSLAAAGALGAGGDSGEGGTRRHSLHRSPTH